MNTSPHEGERTEARKLYELATARLQLMLEAEQGIAACDPGQMSLLQLARHLGKGLVSRIEVSGEWRWHAEAYAWAIVRAMNGRFPSNLKQPSSSVLCSQLVSSFQEGVREGLSPQKE